MGSVAWSGSVAPPCVEGTHAPSSVQRARKSLHVDVSPSPGPHNRSLVAAVRAQLHDLRTSVNGLSHTFSTILYSRSYKEAPTKREILRHDCFSLSLAVRSLSHQLLPMPVDGDDDDGSGTVILQSPSSSDEISSSSSPYERCLADSRQRQRRSHGLVREEDATLIIHRNDEEPMSAGSYKRFCMVEEEKPHQDDIPMIPKRIETRRSPKPQLVPSERRKMPVPQPGVGNQASPVLFHMTNGEGKPVNPAAETTSPRRLPVPEAPLRSGSHARRITLGPMVNTSPEEEVRRRVSLVDLLTRNERSY